MICCIFGSISPGLGPSPLPIAEITWSGSVIVKLIDMIAPVVLEDMRHEHKTCHRVKMSKLTQASRTGQCGKASDRGTLSTATIFQARGNEAHGIDLCRSSGVTRRGNGTKSLADDVGDERGD